MRDNTKLRAFELADIVEGCARESQTEFIRFLEIAFASIARRAEIA
jgi:hypothetical protein